MTEEYMIGSYVLGMCQSSRRVSQNEWVRMPVPEPHTYYTQRKNGENQKGSDAYCQMMARQEL